MSDIPDWAKNRACDIANAEDPGTNWLVTDVTENYKLLETFARYIAAHEEAPVDPLLIAKRQALGEWADLTWGKGSSFAADYRAGKNDDDSNARLAEIALRRGIEIAGGGNG